MSGSKTATDGPRPEPSVRRLTEADYAAWLSMRQALWMGTDATTFAARDGTLFTEPERFGAIRYDAMVVLIDAYPIGFVEVSLRDDIAACGPKPVGYIEGIFVEIAHRRGGLGRILVDAALEWTRSTGATYLVSDVAGDNPESVAFHTRAGFALVEDTTRDGRRHVLFRRRVG
ncbi:MAG TPA: GNAT family N-acetyltransferase [Alphaproteobacteria bacterium]